MKQSASSSAIFSFVALAARILFRASGRYARPQERLPDGPAACCAVAGAIYLAPLGIAGVYLARILQGFGEAFLYTGAATWADRDRGRASQRAGAGLREQRDLGRDVRRARARHTGSVRSNMPRSTQMVLALVGFALLARVTETLEATSASHEAQLAAAVA